MVRSELHRVLTDGLGHSSSAVVFELQIAGRDVLAADATPRRGRIDALLGRTVFEIKSDLRRERDDAEHQLLRYLVERLDSTGNDYVGIATDGAEFQAYVLRDEALQEVGQSFRPVASDPRALPRWLESVVALRDELDPDIETIKTELGRDSVHFARAMRELADIWEQARSRSEVRTKLDIWSRLLSQAYGTEIGSSDLFLQHTYLTIVAKAAATLAFFDIDPNGDPAEILGGKLFFDNGISGAVESDFFDWVLTRPAGQALVMRLVRHVSRFRLRDVEADILKGLYESLIDPETRHDLGEYYTPDWLAQRVVAEAVTRPTEQRVIDPACGSGTFLFHSLRRLVAASNGMPATDLVTLASQHIMGIDVHPVAVIFARATWLLALVDVFSRGRPQNFSVPVYLGDALQWNRREFHGLAELEIEVPAGPDPATEPRERLIFPPSLADNPALFDECISFMVDIAERGEDGRALAAWLDRNGISGEPARILRSTSATLTALAAAGRNHIWGYVARNLSRPIWLASEGQKADVVVGNPPWLAYGRMNGPTQTRFKDEMTNMGLWGGLTSVSGYDLSAYFFARAVHLYLKADGLIAFVVPNAALTRKPYRKFRGGEFAPFRPERTQVRITQAWSFPSAVQPLFPVPCCVLFAQVATGRVTLPQEITVFEGRLPRRDASVAEAATALRHRQQEWPAEQEEASPYLTRFRQGAILVPRRFVFAERIAQGRLQANAALPNVRGRVTSNDKKPWKEVEPVSGSIEARFLRPTLLGESIVPFAVINPFEAVIPEENGTILDSDAARVRGHRYLAEWMRQAEAKFDEHGTKKRTFVEQLDYSAQLSSQFPQSGIRVVYAASGTNPACCIVREECVIEHILYWGAFDTEDEAHYLTAILNSETVRARAEQWQSMGLFGARHFDKVAFNLPIARFAAGNDLHRAISDAGAEAETHVTALAGLADQHFGSARRQVRDSLTEAGISGRIDALVARLLDGV
ncbi:MAG: N-6 DNA methylase [Limimaricola sp.]|uniref:N-6 DNA methylase n=1 Tax=Limimaricola sp. TaxID=2211665 RepID=UPI001D62F4F0|nr:N-6 DNA methylase [Limimaricola sp.]MBI1418774.1 N-6 DNA methylase [Limimaricola sp.]